MAENDVLTMTEAELQARIDDSIKASLEKLKKEEPAGKEEKGLKETDVVKLASEAAVKSVEEFMKTVPVDIKRQLGYAVDGDKATDKMNFAEMLRGIGTGNSSIIKKYGLVSAKAIPGWDSKDASGHMNEATSAEGGYMVPAYFSNKIINLVFAKGTIRPLCTIWPMAGNTLTVPAVSSGITTYWKGEGVTKEQSKPTLAQLALTAYKLIALTTLSDELLADSNPAVEPVLMNLFAIGIANAEDLAFLHGTGASGDPLTGIYNTNGIVSKDASAGGLSFDDIFDVIGDVEDNGANEINIIGNAKAKKIMRKIKGNDGQYVWGEAKEKDPPTIGGYPFLQNRNVKKNLGAQANQTCLIGGDFSNCNIGDRSGLVIARGEMTTDFENDCTSFRAVKRVAFKILEAAANRMFVVKQIVIAS